MTTTTPGLNTRNPWSWYPVVASADLRPGKVMPVVLADEPLTVWRAESGGAEAWSDRCPHRGMRLSFGAVSLNTLICPYHGWTFATDGHCQRIPAHPGMPPSRAIRTRVYPRVEADGYVWVCLGEPATPRPPSSDSTLPHIRTVHLPCEIDVAVAAFLLTPLSPGETAPAPLSSIAVDWMRTDGGLSVKAPWRGGVFHATSAPAGTIVATIESVGTTVNYRVLFQPTATGRCAAHLSATGEAVGMNLALLGLRRLLGSPDALSLVDGARRIIGEMQPAQVHGLPQGEDT